MRSVIIIASLWIKAADMLFARFDYLLMYADY